MHKSSPNTPQERSTSLLLQMVFCALTVVSLLYIPVPILPLLASAYQLPQAQAGLALGAFGIAYATGFMLFGPLSDRLGRRAVLVGGLTFLTIITLALAWVDTPGLFIAGRALQGFAAASFPPVALAYLSERGTPKQRVWAVAWMSTAFLSAGLLGQIYGSVVVSRWGFNWALVPLAVVYALTALRLSAAPECVEARRPQSSLWAGYRHIFTLLADPALRRVYLPALMLLMSFVAFYIGLDMHLGAFFEGGGVSAMQVRLVALPAFLAPLLAPRLIGRWGPQRVATTGVMIAAIGLVLCAGAGEKHVVPLLAASVIYVAGVAISVPGLIACIAASTLPEVRGLAVSFYTFVLFVGASLGPWLANNSRAWSVETLFLVLAAGLGAAAMYSTVRGNRGSPVRASREA
ncbi:MFS transporter [Pseudomonas aeruginosa]|uniref:MFS transporter n=1 Tax=Pseudomonas aeruginosa TaxID=287 RepID=UPI0015586AC3|nr:MFS transporter [Pseudomonas aeruginosa]NPW34584.1 MFS transporter [Pseudomonas aeruginosa]